MAGGGSTPKPGIENTNKTGTNTTNNQDLTKSNVNTSGVQELAQTGGSSATGSTLGLNTGFTGTTGNTGTQTAQQQAGVTSGFTTPDIPDWALPLMQTVTGQYGNALGNVNPADLNLSSVPMQQLLMTAQGGYLGGDQQKQILDAISRNVLPKVTTAFGGAGRSNNFLGADTAARDISDSYLMNFANPERQRMMEASQQINPLEMSNYFGPTAQFGQLAGQLNPLFAPAIGQHTGGTTAEIGTGTSATQMNQAVNTIASALGVSQQDATNFLNSRQTNSSEVNSVIDQILHGMTTSQEQGKGKSTPSYFPGNQVAGGIGGALSGAGTGAMIGSVVPGIGTGVGALAGGLLGGFGGMA